MAQPWSWRVKPRLVVTRPSASKTKRRVAPFGGRTRATDRPLSLVRRLLTRPAVLPPRPRHEPDGWLLAGMIAGPVRRSVGPYVLSGAWWGTPPGEESGTASGVHREYHFAETARGDLFWVFHDRRRRRWYLQGTVE